MNPLDLDDELMKRVEEFMLKEPEMALSLINLGVSFGREGIKLVPHMKYVSRLVDVLDPLMSVKMDIETDTEKILLGENLH